MNLLDAVYTFRAVVSGQPLTLVMDDDFAAVMNEAGDTLMEFHGHESMTVITKDGVVGHLCVEGRKFTFYERPNRGRTQFQGSVQSTMFALVERYDIKGETK